MNNENTFYQNLSEIIHSGEKVEQHLPARLPVIDQALELANLMKDICPKEEYSSLLICAANHFKQFSTPIYIIKGIIK